MPTAASMQQRGSLAKSRSCNPKTTCKIPSPASARAIRAAVQDRQHLATLLFRPCEVANSWLQQRPCSRLHCVGADADAATASSNFPGQQQQQLQLPSCNPHDIIKAVTGDGAELFLEVVPASTDLQAANTAGTGSTAASGQPRQLQEHESVQLAHQGVIYTVDESAGSDGLQLRPLGWQLYPEHPLVKALPGWSKALDVQQSKQKLPQQPLQLQSAAVVYSAAELQAAVQQNPALWRDGTGPNDPPLKGLQYQTLCAGEIECLLNRSRGVVMVQLSVGWDMSAPQPVNNLLVLHALERALGNKHISIFMSKAPEGLGLTAILSAKAEPFRSWAAHLASFGAQAALVADSPYYKLLVGRILGYTEENIRYHIQSTSGLQHPSAEVIAAVEKDLAKLSKKKPELPWKPDAAVGGARGRKQQQQQRSAKSRR